MFFSGIYRAEELPTVMAMYLSVLSRVLIISPEIFSTTLTQFSQYMNETPENLWSQILNVWIHEMPLVSQLELRKLLALALGTLLTCETRSVLECFAGIVNRIIEALNDVLRTDDLGVFIDSLIISSNTIPGEYQDDGVDIDTETEHDQRLKNIASVDPVHTIVLKDFFQMQVNVTVDLVDCKV